MHRGGSSQHTPTYTYEARKAIPYRLSTYMIGLCSWDLDTPSGYHVCRCSTDTLLRRRDRIDRLVQETAA